MGDEKSVPPGENESTGEPEVTFFETVDDIRRALAGEPPAAVLESAPRSAPALPAFATRLESADEVRRAVADDLATTVRDSIKEAPLSKAPVTASPMPASLLSSIDGPVIAAHAFATPVFAAPSVAAPAPVAPAPPPSQRPAPAPSATRLESVEDIRRSHASQPRMATVLEKPPTRPQSVQRDATRLESVEEIRKAFAANQAVSGAFEMPVNRSGTVPFKPARRPPMAVLTICDDGKADGEMVRLRGERLVIGRADGDVRIPHDNMMSTRHAEIVREADQNGWHWTLADMQSTNGTYVRHSRVPFKHGSEILVGSTVLRFEDAALNLPSAPVATGTGGSLPTKTQGWQSLAATDLKASLVHVLPQGLGKRFFLDSAEQWLGRDATVAIALLDDVQVEPRHAKVSRDAKGNWSIEDGGSQNGLWLRVSRHVIDMACEFQLGEQRFVIRVVT